MTECDVFQMWDHEDRATQARITMHVLAFRRLIGPEGRDRPAFLDPEYELERANGEAAFGAIAQVRSALRTVNPRVLEPRGVGTRTRQEDRHLDALLGIEPEHAPDERLRTKFRLSVTLLLNVEGPFDNLEVARRLCDVIDNEALGPHTAELLLRPSGDEPEVAFLIRAAEMMRAFPSVGPLVIARMLREEDGLSPDDHYYVSTCRQVAKFLAFKSAKAEHDSQRFYEYASDWLTNSEVEEITGLSNGTVKAKMKAARAAVRADVAAERRLEGSEA